MNATSSNAPVAPSSPSVLVGLHALIIAAFAGITFVATITQWFVRSTNLWIVGGVLAAVGMGWWLLREHWSAPWSRILVALFSASAVGAVTLWSLLRETASSLYPSSQSVDLTHHFALVQYLYLGQRIPSQLVGYLNEMAFYPYAPHLNTVALAHLTGVEPLRAMTLFGYGIVLLSATLLLSLGQQVARGVAPNLSELASWAAGAVEATVFVVVHTFTGDMLIFDFHYSQVLGSYVVLFLVSVIVESAGSPERRRACAPMLCAGSFLLVFSYPLFIVLPIAVAGCVGVMNVGLDWRRWFGVIPLATSAVFGLALFLPGRLSTGNRIVDNDGVPGISPTLGNTGGPFVAILISVGLLAMLFVATRKRVVVVDTVLAFAFLLLAQMMAMFTIKWVLDYGSSYLAHKLWYLIVWTGVAFVAAGIGALSRILPSSISRSRTFGAAVLGVIVVAMFTFLGTMRHPRPTSPLTTPDYVASATWARRMHPKAGFAVAEQGQQGYIMWVGVLHQSRLDGYTKQVLMSRNTPEQWLHDEKRSLLLTGNLPGLSSFIAANGLEVVHREGDTGVIAKRL